MPDQQSTLSYALNHPVGSHVVRRRLFVFDLDGTLIENHLRRDNDGRFELARPYEDVIVMPGRARALQRLRTAGHWLALATNQGGVAFGHQSEPIVYRKVLDAEEALGIAFHYIGCCYAHPDAPHEQYRDPEQLARRKPEPGMIEDAMRVTGIWPKRTTFVGDLDVDRQAAAAAGVSFRWAEGFFGTAG